MLHVVIMQTKEKHCNYNNMDFIMKPTSIGLRLEKDIKELLTRAAKDDRRSVASFVEKLIIDYLKANNYLK